MFMFGQFCLFSNDKKSQETGGSLVIDLSFTLPITYSQKIQVVSNIHQHILIMYHFQNLVEHWFWVAVMQQIYRKHTVCPIESFTFLLAPIFIW